MGRWLRALLLLGVGCTGDPVEAMTGGNGSGSSGGDPLPQSTSDASADTGSSPESMGGDGSTGTMPTTSSSGEASTDGGSTGSHDEDSSTGTVRIGCDMIVVPESAPAMCSIMSSTSATLRIVNDCETESLEVFWVGYDCGENFWGAILPGSEWQVQSYVTHPWRIRASSDARLMADVPPLANDTELELP